MTGERDPVDCCRSTPSELFTAISTPKTKPYHLNWGATREWRWRYQYSFDDGYLLRKRVIVSATVENTSRARVEHNVSLNSKTYNIYKCSEHNFLLFLFFRFYLFYYGKLQIQCVCVVEHITQHNILFVCIMYIYIYVLSDAV